MLNATVWKFSPRWHLQRDPDCGSHFETSQALPPRTISNIMIPAIDQKGKVEGAARRRARFGRQKIGAGKWERSSRLLTMH